MRGLLDAFETFGGIPLVTVWNNPRTVVISRKGELTVSSPVFGEVVLDYGFAPELCSARSGNQEGAVENLVGWVKGSFLLKCRPFHDRADLEAQPGPVAPRSEHTTPEPRARNPSERAPGAGTLPSRLGSSGSPEDGGLPLGQYWSRIVLPV